MAAMGLLSLKKKKISVIGFAYRSGAISGIVHGGFGPLPDSGIEGIFTEYRMTRLRVYNV